MNIKRSQLVTKGYLPKYIYFYEKENIRIDKIGAYLCPEARSHRQTLLLFFKEAASAVD